MKENKSPVPPAVKTFEASPVDTPDLNPEQFEAVCHTGGHLLVFAGAGSGKTRVLTSRIAFLISETGVHPSEILAVTFTNKAAREMRKRVEKIVPDKISGIWMGTFHSVCARILRSEIEKPGLGYKSNFVIYGTGDQKTVIKKCLAEMDISEENLPPEVIRSLIERFKRDGDFPPSEVSFSLGEKNIRTKLEVIKNYDAALKRSNALDFNDLLMLTAWIFEKDRNVLEKYRKRFRHVLVDEYQDTNRLQYQIIKMLGENNADVCAVGDDSQSIYGWSGADVKNILGFSKDFPDAKIIRLERNYRSTETILKASNALIANNRHGVKKNMWTDGEKGESIVVYEARNEFDETDFIVSKIKSLVDSGGFSPGDFAVLYRTNAQSRLIEDRFLKEPGISCVVVGALSFYARAEIKDLISYMRILTNPSDNAAVARVINTPPRGIGVATFEELSSYSSANGISVMEAARCAAKEGFLKKRATDAVGKFTLMMDGLSDFSRNRGAFDVLNRVIEKSGYGKSLERSEDKKENVKELLNSAYEFDARSPEGEADFREFVEQIALASDSDTEAGEDSAKLMTLHASKGLEFPFVFIVGASEGVIPLIRSDTDDIEEERRLFYVGMTRAMKRLFLCYPLERRLYGKTQALCSSPFLDEIPEQLKNYGEFVSDFIFHRERNRAATEKSPPFAVADKRTGERKKRSLSAGDFVRHAKFGRGKILKTEGTGTRAVITVIFPSAGRKRILAGFLRTI